MKTLRTLGIVLLCCFCQWSLGQSSEEGDAVSAVSGTGTKNYVPLWKNNSELGNSNIFVSTTGSTKGFVGIGTNAPAHPLHIVGQANTNLTLESSVANGNPTISVVANTPAGAAQLSLSRADGGAPAILYLQTAGTNDWTVAVPDGGTDELDFQDGAGHYAMAFLQGGYVGIGTNTPSNLLTLVEGGGPALADGWSTYSSRRFKTNVHPLLGALEKVEQLQGVSYDRKADGKHEIGVIAEEVNQVIPEIVAKNPKNNEVEGVDYSRLSALLIEAVKTQQGEIESLKTQIEELSKK